MELNKATLDCMQKLRRRLREELGSDIHLSQSDVVSALLAACLRSESAETRQLGMQLAELTGSGNAEEPARKRPAPSIAEAPAASLDGEPAGEERQVRIYRGQRIYV